MITGNSAVTEAIVDFSHLEISFSSKPVIMGGTAMEYYGLRKRGMDIDCIVSNEDYHKLAEKYPENRKDMWGDLGLMIGQYELFRSVYRFDYDYFSEGAFEYDRYKVMSFEKLFFMKVLAFKNQPEVTKLTRDFELMVKYYEDNFQNRDYVANASKHIDSYLSAPNGVIYNEKY